MCLPTCPIASRQSWSSTTSGLRTTPASTPTTPSMVSPADHLVIATAQTMKAAVRDVSPLFHPAMDRVRASFGRIPSSSGVNRPCALICRRGHRRAHRIEPVARLAPLRSAWRLAAANHNTKLTLIAFEVRFAVVGSLHFAAIIHAYAGTPAFTLRSSKAIEVCPSV